MTGWFKLMHRFLFLLYKVIVAHVPAIMLTVPEGKGSTAAAKQTAGFNLRVCVLG